MSQSQNQKLFIGNLNFNTEDDLLRAHFEKECGSEAVTEVRIIKSPVGKSLGYAFITFESSEAAQKGLKLDGSDLDGRNIRVSEAQERRRDGAGRPGGDGGRREWGGGGAGGSRDRMGGGGGDRGGDRGRAPSRGGFRSGPPSSGGGNGGGFGGGSGSRRGGWGDE